MKKFLLALLAVAPVYGITITNIAMRGTSHSAQQFEIKASAAAWCQVKFGTSTGVYTYAAGVAFTQVMPNGDNTCAIGLGGLKPGTTYYALATVWPVADYNSTANLCQTSGCGAVEQVFTTSADPAIHPEPPIAPATWTPVEPNTAGYTVVPIRANVTTGNCEAASNVAAPGGGHWSRSILAGDSLQVVYNSIWYQTVVQLTQGLDCYVPGSGSFNAGIILPKYAVNGGPNDYVMTETVQLSPGDFPPFGSRTGAQYASKMGTLRAYTPTMPSAGTQTGKSFVGQLFECGACGANHFWFRNMNWQGRLDTSVYPTNAGDPPQFGYMIHTAASCPDFGGACVPDDLTTSPNNIVIDRIYIAKQPYPFRLAGCFTLGGANYAVIGTKCEADVWLPASFPGEDERASARTLTIPYAYLKMPTAFDARQGMTQTTGYFGTYTPGTNVTVPSVGAHFTFTTDGPTALAFTAGDPIQLNLLPLSGPVDYLTQQKWISGTVSSYNTGTRAMDFVVEDSSYAGYTFPNAWEINRPNKVTFSGANAATYTGAVIAWLDSTGVTVDYQTATGVTASCLYASGCTVTSEASPAAWTGNMPAGAYLLFSGSFTSGTYAHGFALLSYFSHPSRWQAWFPIGWYVTGSHYGIYKNNYMQATGMTIYADTVGNIEDLIFEKNHFYFPRTLMESNPAWDGSFRTYRNIIEFKELNRALFFGNIIDGSASEENAGNPLYVAGSWAGSWSNGTTDWDVRGNLIRHTSSGIQCNGGGGDNPPDAPQAKRIRFQHNLFLDINKETNNSTWLGFNGPSFLSGSLSIYPGCSDVEVDHNTIGRARGMGPALIISGSSNNSPSVVGEGLKYTSNFAMLSTAVTYDPVDITGHGPLANYNGVSFTNFAANPYLPTNHVGTWASRLDGSYVRAGAGGVVTPSWTSGFNVLVAAENCTNAGGCINTGTNWADIGSTGVSTISSSWIDSSSHIIPGSTLATRLTNAGWPSLDLTSGDPLKYRINAGANHAGDSGANVDYVISATGIVTGISVQLGSTYLGFSYTAPDSRACNVDVSSNGTSWSRFTDAGGVRARTLTATGLTAGTAYQYRLLCYFDQPASLEFTTDQITSGTVSTLASATRTVVNGFASLPATATQVLVTLTPLTGSAVTGTCTTSPCSIASVPLGTYNRTIQPQTSGAAAVGEARTAQIKVQ